MAIYIGVGGAVKEVVGGYIGYNGQVLPVYTGNKLPSEYLAVSHIYNIENYSKSLNTNIVPGAYTKIIYVGGPFYGNGSLYWFKAGNYFYGGSYYDSYYKKYYPIGYVGSSGMINETSGFEISQVAYNTVPNNNNLTILNFNKNTARESYAKTNGVNKLLFTNSFSSFTFTDPICLCYEPGHICCYCVIYQNILNSASPTAEYFPAIRKSDGASGLYDTVSKNFLTNDKMSAGPQINQHSLPNMD